MKDDELRKAKFCARGEEIVTNLQHKYQHLDFSLKSYFVVAQISSKHIQLSLHQVVKLASPGEDPASIIIQDEMVHIDDVYDSLCKSIMTSIQFNCQVDYCTTHKNGEDTQYDFQSFEIYSNIYRNLKPYVVELLEKNESNLDMGSKIQLNINTKCDCSMYIFLRDIIEVGLTSVIERNDTKTFALRESIFQLLMPLISGEKPYMFERYVTGTLCQVSSETYGMQIGLDGYPPFIRINSDGNITNTIAEDGSYLLIVMIFFFLCTDRNRFYFDKHIDLDILQLDSSTSTALEKYTLLHSATPGVIYNRNFVIEYDQISNSLSIKVTREILANTDDYIDKKYSETENLTDALTLAYF
ncbi:hypothetical protein INT47_006587 [Mucor saturninus]|uniref:Uncharacterized protein n=1 Tax=Mucor saturninus TaxID=64648 RepID=A0A8H7UVF8_9FUNG|nr:hypothetical protein INT47_006587 [Mucor saturninus]